MKKILGFGADRGGCGWYRMRQPINALKGLADISLLEGGESEAIIADKVDWADVLVCRPSLNINILRFVKNEGKKRIIMDFDDNYWELDPKGSLYRNWGQNEVKIGNEWLWQNGRDGFNMFENRRRLVNLEEAISLADVITVTTPILKEAMDNVHHDVRMLPNYVDLSLYPEGEYKDPNKKNEFRVAWAGGNNHDGDLLEILPQFHKLMEQKDVVLYFIGNDYSYNLKKYGDRVRFSNWVEFQAHPMRLKFLDIDVAVIPLEANTFNQYKSEVKFTEWSALKVPSIVRDVNPYSLVINSSLSVPIKTNDKLLDGIKLLRDKNKANLIAQNAFSWVKNERNLENSKNYILDVYTI